MLQISRLFFISTVSISMAFACGQSPDQSTALKAEPIYENSFDPSTPYVAVIGDSISTGVLANTFAGENLAPSFWFQIIWLLFSDWKDPNAIHKALSNPNLAAATTAETYGLRAALKQRWQLPDLGVVSVAKFGAKSTTVPRLLSTLETKVGNSRKPDFIYFMLGGNDFCSDQTLEEFKTHYQNALSGVHTAYPESRIIVAPLPPVYQLATLNQTSLNASGDPRKANCEQLRMLSCKKIFDADAKDRTLAMNQIVEEAISNSEFAEDQKLFVRGMLQWTLADNEVAADCFHPSEQGQRSLGSYLNQAINF